MKSVIIGLQLLKKIKWCYKMNFLVLCLFLQAVSALPYVHKPVSQSSNERIYLEEKNLQIKTVIENDSLYNLGIIKSNKLYNNKVFLLDYRPHPVVKVLNIDSNKITQIYGYGAGRGPGELINPTDFDISEDGKVWISDEPQSKISIFEPNGELYNDWVIEFTPYKMAGIENDMAIYGSFDPTVKLVDDSKTVVWTSEYIVENPRKWASAITGFLLSDEQSIYKISNFTGELVALNNSGKMKYFRQLIAPEKNLQILTPIPGLDYEAYGIQRSNLNFAAASGFIIGNEIHLLIQLYTKEPSQIIDVYDTGTGDYLHSYNLEEPVRSITSLQDGTIVGMKPDRLIILEQ